MSEKIRNSAKTAIFDLNGNIQIFRRSPGELHRPYGWDWLGGRLEPGETALEAALREAEEEGGIILDPDQIISIGTYRKERDDGVVKTRDLFAAVLIDQTFDLSAEHDLTFSLPTQDYLKLTKQQTRQSEVYQEAVRLHLPEISDLIMAAEVQFQPIPLDALST